MELSEGDGRADRTAVLGPRGLLSRDHVLKFECGAAWVRLARPRQRRREDCSAGRDDPRGHPCDRNRHAWPGFDVAAMTPECRVRLKRGRGAIARLHISAVIDEV